MSRRFLRRHRSSFGANCLARMYFSCSSSWTIPRPTHFRTLRPPTPFSLRGILTDGIIRPSTWKGDGKSHTTDYFPNLGFYCRCCYPGHSHNSDNRINSDITDQLTPELQCALHVASLHGGRTSGRRYFVAGECFSRQFQHYVVRQGGLPCDSIASHFYDVVRNRSDSRYKCRSSTSQVQFAGLFIRTDEITSYGLRRSDIPLYEPPLWHLLQQVPYPPCSAVTTRRYFLPWSSLPT